MARPDLARIHTLMLSLSHLNPQEVYTLDDLLRHLSASEDEGVEPAFRHRLIESCILRGVLGRAGTHYLYRRAPEAVDIRAIAEDEGLGVDPTTEELASCITHLPQMGKRLDQLQHDIEAMKMDRRADTHWLILQEDLMPKSLLNALRAKVVATPGQSGEPQDVHRQMVHLCSLILQRFVKEKP